MNRTGESRGSYSFRAEDLYRALHNERGSTVFSPVIRRMDGNILQVAICEVADCSRGEVTRYPAVVYGNNIGVITNKDSKLCDLDEVKKLGVRRYIKRLVEGYYSGERDANAIGFIDICSVDIMRSVYSGEDVLGDPILALRAHEEVFDVVVERTSRKTVVAHLTRRNRFDFGGV